MGKTTAMHQRGTDRRAHPETECAARGCKKEYFANCPIPLRAFVESLKDEEVSALHTIVWEEHNKREHQKVEAGYYPPLSLEEKNMVAANWNKTGMILAYKARTHVDMLVAKIVVEMFFANGCK